MLHRRVLSYGVLALAAFACDGPVTEPDTRLPAPTLEVVGLPPFSTTLGIDNPNNPTNSVALPNYPKYVLAKVTVSGLTTVTYNPTQEQYTVDARGRFAAGVYNACYEGVTVSFTQWPGTINFGGCELAPVPQDPLVKHVLLRGQGSATWMGGWPDASGACGAGPCRSYEGDKQILIEPVQVDFTVTASPSTVNYNDTVTVTVTIAPAQANGINVPWSLDSTKWAPAFGTQTPPCLWNHFTTTGPGVSTCHKRFTRSGTLTIYATVNGVAVNQALAITVTPPTLEVTASPTTIQGPDSVTFTATATPSSITWNLSSWIWRPDVGTGGLSSNCSWTDKICKRLVSRSGWMKGTATIGEYSLVDSVHVTVNPPTFDVTATPANIPAAQSVTFEATLIPPPPMTWNLSMWTWRPDVGTGGMSAVCNWWEKSCTRTVSKSGWMKASAVIGAYTLVDSVHVVVDPACNATVQTMIAEYPTYNATPQPTCADFTNTGGTTNFSWNELNGGFADGNPHASWGMIRAALTTGLEDANEL